MAPRRRCLPVVAGGSDRTRQDFGKPALANSPTCPTRKITVPLFCHTGGGRNCVVDGDTFWFEGQKYRLADIDTPETHPPRCAQEARLGTQATERLRDWLNSGAFRLEENGRDSDRYGRKLRIATRDGVSVGSVLIDAGLARPWEGYRRPWC